MIAIRFFTALFCTLLCAFHAHGRTITVCIPSNSFPPITFIDHDGQGQWLVRKAVERLGDSVHFEAVPWIRCTNGVAQGSYDAAMPPSAMFLSTMAFPMNGEQVDDAKAVGSTSMVVVRRVDTNASWNGKKFTRLKTPVMFNRGIVSVRNKLLQLGVPADEGAQANESMLQKLLLKRSDLMILNAQTASTELANEPYLGQLEILPRPFLILTLHLAFNRAFYAANRAYVDSIWIDIARMRASAEWIKLAPQLAK